MQPHQIHNFLTRYFTANNSPIIDQQDAYMTIQLTEKLDKKLMNRPFYWHYLKQTGAKPKPMKVTFICNQSNVPDHIKGESVHFGSPRLHQLFSSARKLGSYIRLYEHVQARSTRSLPLHPWLCVNINISFQCDRKKDVLLSIGLNLIHGQIVSQFYSLLNDISLTPKLPDFCFTFSPLITVKSGLIRIRKIVETYIENEDNSWAEEAIKRRNADLQLLEIFYENVEEKQECYHIENKLLYEHT